MPETLRSQSTAPCAVSLALTVHHVTIITQVARDLGEDGDWLWDIANEMEIADGVIWVYGVGEDGILALTDFGIESLIELIKMHKNDPTTEPPLTVKRRSVT